MLQRIDKLRHRGEETGEENDPEAPKGMFSRMKSAMKQRIFGTEEPKEGEEDLDAP
jgi:hypothetical protein